MSHLRFDGDAATWRPNLVARPEHYSFDGTSPRLPERGGAAAFLRGRPILSCVARTTVLRSMNFHRVRGRFAALGKITAGRPSLPLRPSRPIARVWDESPARSGARRPILVFRRYEGCGVRSFPDLRSAPMLTSTIPVRLPRIVTTVTSGITSWKRC